jgi:hypothetical protein
VSPQEARALARAPLRDINGELLSTFILNAVSETWGTPDDLWYYLPRILELVASGDLNSYDLRSLFPVMGMQWRSWPRDQQDAMNAYMTALWQATVTRVWHPGSLSVLDVLEAAGDLGLPADLYHTPAVATCEEDDEEA